MIEENDIFFEYNEFKRFTDIELTDDGNDLKAAINLRNAAGICLFTDRRSNSDDPIPNEQGYPGDVLNEIGERTLGSKWWIRLRGKSLDIKLNDVEADGKEALQWLIDDKIASEINITAAYVGQAKQRMNINVEIVRLIGENLKFNYVWEQPLFEQ